jgi:putative transposase
MPQVARANLCLLQEAKVVTVKGKAKTGLRPHINFCSVRYTSALLASSPALIGKKLRMYYDPRDIRTVKVFFEDGTELGVLTAARPWGIPPHSLKVRQEILRLIEERKLEIREGDTPVEAWVRLRMGQKNRKHVAGQLAKQQRLEDNDAKAAAVAATEAHDEPEPAEEPFIALRPGSPVKPGDAGLIGGHPPPEERSSLATAKVVPINLTRRKTFTF